MKPQQANPEEILVSRSFPQLGLRAKRLHAVEEQGYTAPTPIQIQAISLILEGKDVLAAA
jgi:ATP-dependent RNA helicase RhlE